MRQSVDELRDETGKDSTELGFVGHGIVSRQLNGSLDLVGGGICLRSAGTVLQLRLEHLLGLDLALDEREDAQGCRDGGAQQIAPLASLGHGTYLRSDG